MLRQWLPPFLAIHEARNAIEDERKSQDKGVLGACPIKTLHVVDGKFVASCDGVRRRKRVWDPGNGSSAHGNKLQIVGCIS
jgi:hypothetical protein